MLMLERLPDVLRRTGMKRSTWYRDLKAGKAPRPIRLTDSTVAWLSSDIDTWIESRVKESRPESVPAA